jgi:nucleoside-diphosphate-sugar epimerase
MTILVTGAGSYIAQAVIQRLSEKNLDVVATFRTQCPNVPNGTKLVQLDLSDETGFHKLPKSLNAIIHVAAGTPRHTTREIVHSASRGLLNLQQYALDSCCSAMILTSSVSIHGYIKSSLVDEATPIVEPDIYGASKLLVERTLAATANRLPVIALRLPSVLGRLETEAWVPSLLRRLLDHENVTIFNPEAAFNNAIDVDELSRFIVSLIAKPCRGFHAFPIASSGSMAISDVVELLRSSVGSKSEISIDRSSRRSFTISSNYAIRLLGYKPIGIRDTLYRFIRRVTGVAQKSFL